MKIICYADLQHQKQGMAQFMRGLKRH